MLQSWTSLKANKDTKNLNIFFIVIKNMFDLHMNGKHCVRENEKIKENTKKEKKIISDKFLLCK